MSCDVTVSHNVTLKRYRKMVLEPQCYIFINTSHLLFKNPEKESLKFPDFKMVLLLKGQTQNVNFGTHNS